MRAVFSFLCLFCLDPPLKVREGCARRCRMSCGTVSVSAHIGATQRSGIQNPHARDILERVAKNVSGQAHVWRSTEARHHRPRHAIRVFRFCLCSTTRTLEALMGAHPRVHRFNQLEPVFTVCIRQCNACAPWVLERHSANPSVEHLASPRPQEW